MQKISYGVNVKVRIIAGAFHIKKVLRGPLIYSLSLSLCCLLLVLSTNVKQIHKAIKSEPEENQLVRESWLATLHGVSAPGAQRSGRAFLHIPVFAHSDRKLRFTSALQLIQAN